MKKNRWNRVVALVLTLVLLASTVSASGYTLDLSGDGKVNVWDIQVAVNENKGAAHEEAILDNILAGGDELHPNAEGKYEIWTILGLRNMAEHSAEGATFVLMADVDMKGADWTPVPLKGTFDGNLHTISNVNITTSVESTYAGTDDMGFFSIVDNYKADGKTVQSEVKNLNLKNVHITATDRAQFIGLIAGSNRGKIINCTTTGIITDNRTTLPDKTYVGAFVGRNNDSTPPGTITAGANTLTFTDKAGNVTEGLSSQLALQLAELTYPEGTEAAKQFARNVGIAGASKDANIDKTMTWQDVSNNTALLSQSEQSLRSSVEQKMYQMGTVKWTPSETVTFTRYNGDKAQPSHVHSNAYLAGETYTGIPYVGGHNGSYERFMSKMQAQQDSQGRYVTVTGLENGTRQNNVATGMSAYLGNNCSVAVGWAYASALPTRVFNDDMSKVYGGTAIRSAYFYVPNAYNTARYGVVPVGNYQLLENDATKFPQASDARDTRRIIAAQPNGAMDMAEAYAKAHKGDAITYAEYTYDKTANTHTYVNSHIRLLADDPVIIRNYKNVIDMEASYVLTHEQGDGLYDNKDSNGKWLKTYTDGMGTYNVKYTSWRINHKYTLSVLLTEEGYTAAKNAAKEAETKGTFVNGMQPGCGWGYVPVTANAFTNGVAKRTPYYSPYPTHPISFPNVGWYYSNYWTISGTMIIQDADGNEVYNQTKYFIDRRYSNNFDTIKLDKDFPDAEDNLVEGKTYKMTLCFMASNGKVTYLDKDAVEKNSPVEIEFVYVPTTDTGTDVPDPEIPEQGEDTGNE